MASFLETILNVFRGFFTEWDGLNWIQIKFDREDEAVLYGFILGGMLMLALVVRYLKRGKIGVKQIILPAVVPTFKKSPWRFVRHVPVMLFVLGLPFFFIAFADPYLSFVKEETTYPGRRIAILLDASGSMDAEFLTQKLKGANNQRFFVAVSAAKYFVEVRMKGQYKDLMALLEFGNESYIITPFTNDYKNILMSISLISEPEERARFSDTGTIIIRAIKQSVDLFKSFDFLESAGNVIVIISDGEDSQLILGDRTLDSILAEAKLNNIPIYFIRTAFNAALAGTTSVNYSFYDSVWKPAVEKTGGKFYAAENEEVILKAIHDIDRSAVGKIKLQRFSSKKPVFRIFILTAIILWISGLVLLSFRLFRTFP